MGAKQTILGFENGRVRERLWPRATTTPVQQDASDFGFDNLLQTMDAESWFFSEVEGEFPFARVLLQDHAPRSQYDLLITCLREKRPLPSSLLCVAASGSGFHGLRQRPWSSPPGNLYVCAYWKLDAPITDLVAGLIMLPAVAAVKTLDRIPGLANLARCKWVNDIWSPGGKVGGVLSYAQERGGRLKGLVLGIGLNINTTPVIEPDAFVPRASCARSLIRASRNLPLGRILWTLSKTLDHELFGLLDRGSHDVWRFYTERSAILGQEVRVVEDEAGGTGRVLGEGKVERIGPDLSLHLAGSPQPITRGRLILSPARK